MMSKLGGGEAQQAPVEAAVGAGGAPRRTRKLELFPADIAWRYTPAKANPQDRLRPWLGLIVLRDDEIDTVTSPTSAQPLATMTTKASAGARAADALYAAAARAGADPGRLAAEAADRARVGAASRGGSYRTGCKRSRTK